MGFIHWVGRIFTDARKDVGKAVTGTINAVTTLYHVLTNLGHNVGRAWAAFHSAIDAVGRDIEQLGNATWHKLRDIYHRFVPALIRHAIATAAHYAAKVADDVRRHVEGIIHDVRVYAVRIVHDLRAWTETAIHDVRATLSKLSSSVATIQRNIGDLLKAPENMAKWVFGALVNELIPWLAANGEALGSVLFHKGGQTILRNADKIESIIADII